jgi:hypothetical protein
LFSNKAALDSRRRLSLEGTKGDFIQSILSGMLPLSLLVLIVFSSNNTSRVYGMLYGAMLITAMFW